VYFGYFRTTDVGNLDAELGDHFRLVSMMADTDLVGYIRLFLYDDIGG
jgi:hypothetical protein